MEVDAQDSESDGSKDKHELEQPKRREMSDEKFTVVLLAPENTPDGRGRLLHAMATAIELKEAGRDVEFYFDGIGVECLTAFHEKSNPFSTYYVKMFDEVRAFSSACGVCAKHFGADEAATELEIPMTDFDHHRSLAQMMIDGRKVVTF